jgi:hypothetical protein
VIDTVIFGLFLIVFFINLVLEFLGVQLGVRLV